MKSAKNLLLSASAAAMMLFGASHAYAQYYCFFVDNQSGQPFNALKIRPNGTGQAMSRDLLPSDVIESGKHFWVKTADDNRVNVDVQITKMDGKPLLFSWTDVSGNYHKAQKFITVNAKNLHTLVISENDDGDLTYGIYNDDRFGYGDPC